MIRAALYALALVAIVGGMLASLAIHYNLTIKFVAIVMAAAALLAFIVFVDETRQHRRKWRDHPARRHPIIKDWK